MTSRERIRTAIRHKEPDRVPRDCGATPSSGISTLAYKDLKEYLNIAGGQVRVYDVVQQLAQPEDWFIDRFKIDALDIGRSFNTEDSDWQDLTLPTGQTVQLPAWFHPVDRDDGGWDALSPDGTRIASMPKTGTFFDQTYFPYLDGYPDHFDDLPQVMPKILWAGLVHSPWDHANDPGFWETLRARAIEMRETTDKALMVVAGCNLFEWGTFLRRLDNFLADIMLEPDNVERMLDALMEIHLQTLEKVCEAVGDVVDMIRFGDDLGMDMGPFMAPDLYRKLFKPRHTILCDYVKKHSTMKTFLHSCGSIYMLLPDLIEAGYDIINPVQINSKDMDPAQLKKEFGNDIVFWGGGCDTRKVLNRGTPQDVKNHVKGLVDIFAPGGGFVFNTVHNILPDVPPDNIVAMFEALDEV